LPLVTRSTVASFDCDAPVTVMTPPYSVSAIVSRKSLAGLFRAYSSGTIADCPGLIALL
jgi:hypothetical protein